MVAAVVVIVVVVLVGGVGLRKQGTCLRRRWGGRFGAQRMREVLPAAEMLAKVGSDFCSVQFRRGWAQFGIQAPWKAG